MNGEKGIYAVDAEREMTGLSNSFELIVRGD